MLRYCTFLVLFKGELYFMRKFIFMALCFLYCMIGVNALTANHDGSLTNEKGAMITKEQYDRLKLHFDDETIDNLSLASIVAYSNPAFYRKENAIHVITTYKLDKNGNVKDEYSAVATFEQVQELKKNKNLIVNEYGLITRTPVNRSSFVDGWNYSTESKSIYAHYTKVGNSYVLRLWAKWNPGVTPVVKKYDVMAMRWNNPVSNISNFVAWQDCDSNTGRTVYSLDGTNMKRTPYGIGVSMDIHDSAQDLISLYMQIESPTYFGYDFYATYQHARNSNVTLAISKSYSFSSNGLGGVLYYSNTTYRSYYDGMRGLHYHFEEL